MRPPTFRHRMPLFALAVSLLLAGPAPAAAQTTAERLDAHASAYHDRGLFNGAVLVAEEGRTIYARGFGEAVMEWDVPVTPQTRFRIGSVTKQFTAALILQLMEEGKIDLEAPVTRYVSDYPADPGDRITIHHLLTHTSGIPSYTGIPGFMEEHVRDPFEPDSFARLFWSLPLEFDPGARWHYNNSGYYLLGVVIERVTGQPYDVALQERILDPLGLDDTGYDHYGQVVERKALGYRGVAGGYERAAYLDTAVPYAAGMMYSTVEDLLKWDQALKGTGPFQRASTLELFQRPFEDVDPGTRYGYGWLFHDLAAGADTVAVIGHGGGIFGFTTGFWRMPDERRTIVAMDNTEGDHVEDLIRDLALILHGEEPDLPKQPIADVLAAVIDADGVEAGVARYRELKASHPDDYDFSEDQLNQLGYRYLRAGDTATAIRVFELNVEMFPEAFNPWDSLAEAHLEAGDRDLAIQHYRKSLELNPANENARQMLASRLDVEVAEPERVDVPAAVLESYVGAYQLQPGFVLDVSVEGEALYAQATGQPRVELHPVSPTEFLVREVSARVVFAEDGSSLTLHQGGQEMPAPRME